VLLGGDGARWADLRRHRRRGGGAVPRRRHPGGGDAGRDLPAVGLPTLAAIPLFTLTGFLLAEGRASVRLLDVFRGLFGWIPGGTAVVCALLCAFFTIFTGGSGVTILALGGLLLPGAARRRYRDRFSVGLLTASGSLGLLLPPGAAAHPVSASSPRSRSRSCSSAASSPACCWSA
jgi:hypothetical protein